MSADLPYSTKRDRPSDTGAPPAIVWSAAPLVSDLGPGETHLVSLALDLPAGQLAELERFLSSDELARAERFRFAQGRGRYVAARGQLRAILGRYLRRRAADVRFHYGRFGKPALAPGSGDDRIRFNASGSADLGLVAIRLDEEVGVDVEQVRPIDDALAIAERNFAASEFRALSSLPPGERVDGFFRYWTRKEAVVKSIGLGLNSPLDGFVVSLGSAGERVTFESEGVPVVRWVGGVPNPREAFVAALATGSRGPIRCGVWIP